MERLAVHRVLIVGGGVIGERHARSFLATGRVQIGLCEQRASRLADLEKAYPLVASAPNVNALQLSDFDAAVVAVPAHLHIPFGRQFADAGLHVLIEKPLSLSLEGVDELARAGEKHKAIIRVAFPRRTMPLYRQAKEAINGGRVGEVASAVFSLGYDHAEARPDYVQSYFSRRETGGGVVHDTVSHMMDLLQWLIGPVAQVTCACDHLQMKGIEVEDTAFLFLRFRGKRTVASLDCNLWQAHRTERLALSGAGGTILCDGSSGEACVFVRGQREWAPLETSRELVDRKQRVASAFVDQANWFLDEIEGQGSALCTLAEAKNTVAACLAAIESNRRQRPVKVSDYENVKAPGPAREFCKQ